ncbi:ring finger protein, conserved [Leishmania tarentolae]|uniref:Ring finger protein, conserved n=1 Tax=Leishmania tarentolae TaxID=5689 RepID=A0A640KU74_LEITA|nr:ring finger protein, conserved [Leishmania tarentolae]
MLTQLKASQPAQRPPDHQDGKTTDAPPSRRPSPMTFANFSFTQFFAALDEAAAEEQSATADVTATAPVTVTSASSAVPSESITHMAKTLPNTATLSLHDCVLLKLSLTCALCGRLLRHRPAAIETCGHCFCYACINNALENGCVPRRTEWPWSTLEKEVNTAELRWSAATVVPTSEKSSRGSTAAATPGSAPQANEETADGHPNCHEVQLETPLGPRVARPMDAQPSRHPRKLRKVRQMCPLCLGPAFKWMLVPLQRLADLCNALHLAYPGLEGALGQLTTKMPDSAASITESRAVSANRDEAGGQIHSELQWHARPASDSSDLIAAAFTPRLSVPGAQDWRSSQDEEAERRCRRRSGGPRKEITFAADIASRVPHISAQVAADAQPTANETFDPVSEARCVAHSAGVEAIEEEMSNSAEAEEEDSVAGAEMASVLQLSADLIPSPSGIFVSAFPAATTQTSCHTVSPSSKQRVAELNAPNRTPLLREEVLGHSPTDANEDGDTQKSGKGGVDAVVRLDSTPADQNAKDKQGTAVAAANASAPQVLFPFLAAARHHCLLLDTVSTLSDKRSALYQVATSPTRTKEADGVLPPSAWPPTPLGGIDAILRGSASSTSGWSVVWDGVNETKSDNSSGSDEGCPATLALACTCTYSTVRAAEGGQELAFPEEKNGSSGIDREQRCPALTGAFSGVSRHTGTDGVASVHMQDVWELHTALIRRHPQLSPCFAVLRYGRVRWQTDVATEDDDSESAFDSACDGAPHPLPPILCVVGHYPQQPLASCRRDPSGLRLLPMLTPTACTALVLGVPCMDMAWVASPTSLTWRAHAVSGWQTSTTVADSASSPFESERQRPNAFQDILERLAGASRASSQPQRLAEPLPASWMATTQRALSAHLHPTAQASDTQNGVGSTVAHTAADAYLFFLLPDGATWQLGEMLYRQWIHEELRPSEQAKKAPSLVRTPLVSLSRKRRRDGVHVSGVTCGVDSWSSTDGHPQRAWRRLLLVAGGAAVELSWTLFEALVATAASFEGGDSGVEGQTTTDMESLVNSLTSHLRHRRTSGTHNLWVHVDVAECSRESSPSPQSAASPIESHGAQHTFFLLYSMAVARDVFAQLVAENEVHGKSSSGDHGAVRTRAYLQRFKVFLDRLAALVALVAAPVVPRSSSLYDGTSHRQEARPSSWLLENIAQGCCSAGSSVENSALSQAQGTFSDVSASCIITGEAPSSGDWAMRQLNAGSFSTGKCGADGEWQVEGGAFPSLQRAGVYRSLIYADTP